LGFCGGCVLLGMMAMRVYELMFYEAACSASGIIVYCRCCCRRRLRVLRPCFDVAQRFDGFLVLSRQHLLAKAYVGLREIADGARVFAYFRNELLRRVVACKTGRPCRERTRLAIRIAGLSSRR
jgi:hypothetical protein